MKYKNFLLVIISIISLQASGDVDGLSSSSGSSQYLNQSPLSTGSDSGSDESRPSTPEAQIIPRRVLMTLSVFRSPVVPFVSKPAEEEHGRSPTPMHDVKRSSTPGRPLGTVLEGRRNMRNCCILTGCFLAPLNPDHRTDALVSSHEHAEFAYKLAGLLNFEEVERSMELDLADCLIRVSMRKSLQEKVSIQRRIDALTVQLTKLRDQFNLSGGQENINERKREIQARLD